jgi:tubulin alpha
MFDNSALDNICSRNLLVTTPSLANINSVISQWVSSFTAPFRFGSSSERSMKGLYSRLVPYHSLKLLMPSYSPLFPSEMPFYEHESLSDTIANCFEPANMMVKCDPRNGKYMAAYFGFRGDIPTNHINLIIFGRKIRRSVQFVDWCPTCSIIELTKQYPVHLSGDCLASAKESCCGLSNNTAFREVVNRMLHKFDSIF